MWYSDGDGEFATPISNSLPQVSRYIDSGVIVTQNLEY